VNRSETFHEWGGLLRGKFFTVSLWGAVELGEALTDAKRIVSGGSGFIHSGVAVESPQLVFTLTAWYALALTQ